MDTVRALALARSHHDTIDRDLAEVVRLLGCDPLEARYPLARARWALVGRLRAYHLFKTVEIFDPAIRSGSADQVKLATSLRASCAQGWTDYCAYVQAWSGRDVAAQWAEHVATTHALTDRLRSHLAEEERMIAGLLLGADRTRFLTSPVRATASSAARSG